MELEVSTYCRYEVLVWRGLGGGKVSCFPDLQSAYMTRNVCLFGYGTAPILEEWSPVRPSVRSA